MSLRSKPLSLFVHGKSLPHLWQRARRVVGLALTRSYLMFLRFHRQSKLMA